MEKVNLFYNEKLDKTLVIIDFDDVIYNHFHNVQSDNNVINNRKLIEEFFDLYFNIIKNTEKVNYQELNSPIFLTTRSLNFIRDYESSRKARLTFERKYYLDLLEMIKNFKIYIKDISEFNQLKSNKDFELIDNFIFTSNQKELDFYKIKHLDENYFDFYKDILNIIFDQYDEILNNNIVELYSNDLVTITFDMNSSKCTVHTNSSRIENYYNSMMPEILHCDFDGLLWNELRLFYNERNNFDFDYDDLTFFKKLASDMIEFYDKHMDNDYDINENNVADYIFKNSGWWGSKWFNSFFIDFRGNLKDKNNNFIKFKNLMNLFFSYIESFNFDAIIPDTFTIKELIIDYE